MSKQLPDCPFCSPPADLVMAESQSCVAIRDGYPVSEGHALIIPRRHVASFFDLSENERRDMLQLVDQVRQLLESREKIDGYNIGLNDGAAAGQTVMHVHLHVIPRRSGDVEDPRGGIRWVLPGKARYWSDGR